MNAVAPSGKTVKPGDFFQGTRRVMSTLERIRRLQPADMNPQELEMARTAQRCIGEALDRSRVATITLVSDDGELPPVQVPQLTNGRPDALAELDVQLDGSNPVFV